MSSNQVSEAKVLKGGMLFQITKRDAALLSDRVFNDHDRDRDGKISLRESKMLLKEANKLVGDQKIPRELSDKDYEDFFAMLHRVSTQKSDLTKDDFAKIVEEYFINEGNNGSKNLSAQHSEYFDVVKIDMKKKSAEEVKNFILDLAYKRFGKELTNRSLEAAKKLFGKFDKDNSNMMDESEFFEMFKSMLGRVNVQTNDDEFCMDAYKKLFEIIEFRQESSTIEVLELEAWFLRGMLSS